MIFIVILGSFGVSAITEASDIPKQIRDLVFINSKFSTPITKIIPYEDEPGMAEKIKRGEEESKSGKVVFYKLALWNLLRSGAVVRGGPGIDRAWLNFLIKNDYVRIEKVFIFELLHYNDKIIPYILRKFYIHRIPFDSAEILLASRKLKTIDYTNQYEGTLLTLPGTGAKTQFYALTFSYTFEGKFSGLPNVNKIYKGKAKAVLDPDDGQWKLWGDIELEDSGSSEYSKLIEQQYKDFKIEPESELTPIEEPISPVKKEQEPITLEAALRQEQERINTMEKARKQQVLSLEKEGTNAMKNRDWNAAVQAYKKLLETDPENYATYVNIGNAYAMLNEFDLSFQHLLKANQLIPAAPEPYIIMVYAYARKGDKDRAIEALQNAMDRGFNNLSHLKKDTDLPEDFRQDLRFKELFALNFEKIVNNIKDADLFGNHSQELPYKYDDVWAAVDYVLKDQDEKIIESDKETGVIRTDLTRHGFIGFPRYDKYCILIEKINGATKISLKLFSYNRDMEGRGMKELILKPQQKNYVNERVLKFMEKVKEKL